MGGPSQRPVTAPSTERQSDGVGWPPCCACGCSASCRPRPTARRSPCLPSRRAWGLLAWLALHPGEHARGVGRRALLARRARLERPRLAAQRAVGAAAGAGDDEALVAGRDRIALRCETDLAAFDAFVAAGRLEGAVALHRGPLLADLDDDWVLEARDEHAERLGEALARLAAAAERPADAVGWARRRLALDPLDEGAARDLMRRLADAGDRAGALAVYDRLSDRLRTRSAWRRRRRPARCPRSGGGRSRHRRARPRRRAGVGGLPLVGREAISRAAHRVWGRCAGGRRRRGHRRRGGDREDAAGARAGGPRAADGRAPPACTAADLGGGPPYGPWVELLAGLARELARRPPRPVAGGARRGWRRRCRCGSAGRGSRRPRCRPSSHGRGCSRRRSNSPSTRPPTGRSCCCSTTSTSPTRRRSS